MFFVGDIVCLLECCFEGLARMIIFICYGGLEGFRLWFASNNIIEIELREVRYILDQNCWNAPKGDLEQKFCD